MDPGFSKGATLSGESTYDSTKILKKAWNRENVGHLKYPEVENSDFALNVNVSLTILILDSGGSRLLPEVTVCNPKGGDLDNLQSLSKI